MNTHPIFIVDDDTDDSEIIKALWEELRLPNELIFFTEGNQLVKHLKESDQIPFIIICDLNLPLMDGFQVREKLLDDPETRYKTVPFIFWSNSVSEAQIKKAYDLSAHGIFIKGSSYQELKKSFEQIVGYWETSLKPK